MWASYGHALCNYYWPLLTCLHITVTTDHLCQINHHGHGDETLWYTACVWTTNECCDIEQNVNDFGFVTRWMLLLLSLLLFVLFVVVMVLVPPWCCFSASEVCVSWGAAPVGGCSACLPVPHSSTSTSHSHRARNEESEHSSPVHTEPVVQSPRRSESQRQTDGQWQGQNGLDQVLQLCRYCCMQRKTEKKKTELMTWDQQSDKDWTLWSVYSHCSRC